jgi:hypothetical protein
MGSTAFSSLLTLKDFMTRIASLFSHSVTIQSYHPANHNGRPACLPASSVRVPGLLERMKREPTRELLLVALGYLFFRQQKVF